MQSVKDYIVEPWKELHKIIIGMILFTISTFALTITFIGPIAFLAGSFVFLPSGPTNQTILYVASPFFICLWLITIGYLSRCASKNDAETLPGWTKITTLLSRGFRGFITTLLYAIPFGIVLMFILLPLNLLASAIITGMGAAVPPTGSFLNLLTYPAGLITLALALLTVLIQLLAFYIVTVAFTQFSHGNSIGDGLNVTNVFSHAFTLSILKRWVLVFIAYMIPLALLFFIGFNAWVFLLSHAIIFTFLISLLRMLGDVISQQRTK